MSFSGQSNAPWQRNNMMFHQGGGGGPPPQQMFMQQAPQGPFGHGPIQSSGGGIFPQGGGGSNVSYPQRATGLNPVAFQQGTGGSGGGGGQSQQYNSIGTVTKINSDCGLVNDEVFFYRNVCKGQAPKLGDRVLFEATFSATGQFKWNATRIQSMAHQPQPLMGSGGGGKGFSGYNAVPPPNEYQRGQQRHNSPRRSSPARGDRARDHARSERERRERERNHRSRDRDDAEEQDRKRRREDHHRSRERAKHSIERKDRERERERARDRERVERTERSPHRVAPKGRRARTIRRYMVQIPKLLLSYKHADIQELRQRYTTLYIPSDFFHANIKWSESFTPDNPFSLRRPCQFHVKHRIVEPPFEQKPELLEPADADYLYSAKVMLIASPPIAELYQKCFEDDDSDNEQNTVHPSRLISFLVGTRERNEPMAIGGPWSPSLDGENPDKDPSVLIRTAIRTCKAMTGIDLSNCTQWYRFMELYYHRNDHKSKDKDAPPRIERVVMYLPDVHSCMPSRTEWQNLTQVYKTALENVIARKNAAVAASKTASSGGGGGGVGNGNADDGDGDGDSAEEKTGKSTLANNDADKVDENSDVAEADTSAENAVDATAAAADVKHADDIDVAENKKPAAALAAKDVAADGDDNVNEKDDSPEPTHYSMLDLKSMKVQEIREELIARNLPSKGVRNLVMARLAKALNTEKSEEINAKQLVKKLKSAESESKETDEQMEVEEDNDAGEKEKDPKPTKKQTKTIEKRADTENVDEAEDHDDWADVIDVDMSDIVILDEYDSSKNPEETPKEMDERDKNQLIRRYSLPSEERIVVHPYKSKNGKFDCTVKSLSVLLDYRPENTKERFFEVSLFAELFNEMLMRDFGFNIYKELYVYKDTNAHESGETKDEDDTSAANNNKKDEADTNAKEDDEVKKTKENVENQKLNADATNEKSEKSEKAAARERRPSKRSIDEEPEEDSQSTDRKRKSNADKKEKEKDKNSTDKKMVVVKPQLLLSFVYFDTSHCGYIFEKDLEDLFSILGLNLSRGQIRKVLGKVASRQAFYYRKLTDKEEASEVVPTIDGTDEIPSEELKRIALGNRFYEYVFSGVAKNDGDAKNNAVVATSCENDGLINYNGAVIHVGKLIEQIKRTEKNFSDLEKLHIDLRKQHTDLQKDHSKSSGKIKDLQSEVKSLNRKISDADQDLFSLNRKYRDQHSTLSYIYNRVSPYFSREKDKEKEKDKDHKSDSSRDKETDKDKDKDKKDKEKEKEKEKDSKDGGSGKDSHKEIKDSKDEKKTEKNKDKDHVKEEDKNKKNGEKELKNCSNQKGRETKADIKEKAEAMEVTVVVEEEEEEEDEDEEDVIDDTTEE